MKRAIAGVAVLALACGAVALVGAGCSGKSGGSNPGGPTPTPTNSLGGVHYEFTNAGFSEPAQHEEYRCWYVDVPTGGASAGDVGAYRFSYSSTSNVLHHMVVFTSTDTSAPNGSNAVCNIFETPWTIRYAGGKQTGPLVLPTGVAEAMGGPTQRFVIQLHLLNAGDTAVADDTKLDIDFTRSGTSYTHAGVVYSGSQSFTINPTGAPQDVLGTCTVPNGTPPVTVFAIWPHMHKIGTHFHIDLSGTTLLDWNWDFNNQPMYLPSNGGISVSGGSTINTDCTYVNSTGNPVGYGESSTQEMCYDFFYYYPAPTDQSIPCFN